MNLSKTKCMKKLFTIFISLSAMFGRLSSVSLRYSVFEIPFPFFLLSFPFASAQVNPDSCLVAYYPFNGNANDESGNGNNGTVNGAILSADRFGVANNAYSFDGVNDFFSENICTFVSEGTYF